MLCGCVDGSYEHCFLLQLPFSPLSLSRSLSLSLSVSWEVVGDTIPCCVVASEHVHERS